VTRLPAFALACLVLGVFLMVVVDLIWLGVPLLFAFIVAGVFAIADPEFLDREDG
jgi:hypothetical protein